MEISYSILSVVGLPGLIIVLAGWWMGVRPPKKINHIYGYRAPSSMKSQERWDFAQIYSSKQMMISGAILIFLSVPLAVIAWSELSRIFIGLTLIIGACIYIFIKTERAIKQHFGG